MRAVIPIHPEPHLGIQYLLRLSMGQTMDTDNVQELKTDFPTIGQNIKFTTNIYCIYILMDRQKENKNLIW